MGMSFPDRDSAAVHRRCAATTHPQPARRVGRLYALNVAGAIAGALLGGFVLLPLLGSRRALIATAALYGASACPAGDSRLHRGRAVLVATALAVRCCSRCSPCACPIRLPRPSIGATGATCASSGAKRACRPSVSVHASQFRRSLYLDGLHQANDTPDMVRLHRIIGHLPMVLHPAPADALVVGLGGGATAGAVSQYPGVARADRRALGRRAPRGAVFLAHQLRRAESAATCACASTTAATSCCCRASGST